MRYVLLIYSSEGLAQEERAAIMRAHPAFLQEVQQRGLLTGGAALQPTSSATTVRLRDGKTMITDGPFAETREQLAGYLVFRSTFLPRTVGMLLAIGGLCYLTYSFATFLSPGFAAHLVPYIQLPSGVAELSLCLWLLVMGVNVSRWEKQESRASEPDSRVPGRAAV